MTSARGSAGGVAAAALVFFAEPCHSPKDATGKLDVSSYKALLKGGKTKDFIVVGEPDKSLLVKDIIGKDPPMPKNANPLTPEQIETIRPWIKDGAKNN